MINKYNLLMKKCIKLAEKGKGKVSPNPLVGCIIFDDNFRIISTGYHQKYGENHAERNAILNSKEDLKGMNLIVNLEPCSHYGKTPPCADLIIEKGIKKVIIGMQDPNPIVSGRGIKKLIASNIEVITGVLEQECKELNKIFIKNQTENKPFITIKTASTLDGKMATTVGTSKWITDEVSRKEVQKLRNEYDGILTSAKTVITDNPSMTCRIKNGVNPVRIIADRYLKTTPDLKIFEDNKTRVIIVTDENLYQKNQKKFPEYVEIITCPIKNNYLDINIMCDLLYKKGISSILIEAGGQLNNAFIQSNAADELILFLAPKILADKDGINFVYGEKRNLISECNNLIIKSTKKLKNDIMILGSFIKTAGETK